MRLGGIRVTDRRTGARVPGAAVIACDQAGHADIRVTDGNGEHLGWNFSGAGIAWSCPAPGRYANQAGYLAGDVDVLEIALDPR